MCYSSSFKYDVHRDSYAHHVLVTQVRVSSHIPINEWVGQEYGRRTGGRGRGGGGGLQHYGRRGRNMLSYSYSCLAHSLFLTTILYQSRKISFPTQKHPIEHSTWHQHLATRLYFPDCTCVYNVCLTTFSWFVQGWFCQHLRAWKL